MQKYIKAKIEEVDILSYRKLKNLTLKDVGTVNIIVGKNNTGKTSILEALNIATNPFDYPKIIKTAEERSVPDEMELQDIVFWLFPFIDSDNRDDISIKTRFKQGEVFYKLKYEGYKKLVKTDEEESKKSKEFNEFKAKIQEFNAFLENYMERKMDKKKLEYFEKDSFTPISYNFKIQVEDLEKILLNKQEEEIDFSFIKNNEYSWTGKPENKNLYREIINKINKIKVIYLRPTDRGIKEKLPKEFSKVIKEGFKEDLIKLLQNFDEKITNVEILIKDEEDEQERPYISIEHEIMGRVPVSSFGSGLEKTLAFAIFLLSCQNGILLIDEIETSIHFSAFEKIFKFIVNACMKYNIQLFATTHSLEAIDAIIYQMKDDKESLNELVLYLLQDEDNKIEAVRFSGKSAYNIRYEFAQELRG